MVNFVFGLLILANTSFVLEEIRDQDIFYNFIYYQNELYVGAGDDDDWSQDQRCDD